MHLVGPALNTNGKTKKKPTPAQLRAKAEHEAWLKKQGLHPDQLAAKQSNKKPAKLKSWKGAVDSSAPCSNGFALGGAKKSVFDSEWQNPYEDDPEMAQREAQALAKAQALKSQIMPLYNKGPTQLMTSGLKMTDLGKRRP